MKVLEMAAPWCYRWFYRPGARPGRMLDLGHGARVHGALSSESTYRRSFPTATCTESFRLQRVYLFTHCHHAVFLSSFLSSMTPVRQEGDAHPHGRT